jgi:hypothetical protein
MNIDVALYPHGSFIHTMGMSGMKKQPKKLTPHHPNIFLGNFSPFGELYFFKYQILKKERKFAIFLNIVQASS